MRQTIRRQSQPLIWAATALFLIGITGCATTPRPEETVRLVWPPPPLTTRIEFVRSIVSDEDVGQDATFSQRLVDFLGGEAPSLNRIVEPMGLAVADEGQRLYVSDFANLAVFVFDFTHRTFRKFGEEGLARPVGLALDGQGHLFVVEQEKRGISVFNGQGKRVRFITHPTIERPTGIAIDREGGKIYLADSGHNSSKEHTIKLFNYVTGELIGTIGQGKGEGPGQFMFPTYLAVDKAGNLYVTDTLNSRIQVFDPDGRFLKTIGQRGNSWGMFDKPKGVALDSFGNIYVADSGWSNVQIFNQKGQPLLFFGGRGPIPGMLKNPTAIAIDRDNRIYVADYLNHRVEMYRLVNTTAEDSFLDPVAGTQGRPDERRQAVTIGPQHANEGKLESK